MNPDDERLRLTEGQRIVVTTIEGVTYKGAYTETFKGAKAMFLTFTPRPGVTVSLPLEQIVELEKPVL